MNDYGNKIKFCFIFIWGFLGLFCINGFVVSVFYIILENCVMFRVNSFILFEKFV